MIVVQVTANESDLDGFLGVAKKHMPQLELLEKVRFEQEVGIRATLSAPVIGKVEAAVRLKVEAG